MRTVGQILLKSRLSKSIEIGEIAKITKIQVKYLEALERDDYEGLPSSTTAKGFIKLYGGALGLPVQTLISVFRRDFTEDRKGQIIPRGVVKPLSSPGWSWTPRHTLVASVFLILLGLGGFFYREYMILIAPPAINLETPKNNSEVRGSEVVIRGKADRETEVNINGEKVQIVDDGSFAYVLSILPGENIITITVKDRKGRTNSIQRTVVGVP